MKERLFATGIGDSAKMYLTSVYEAGQYPVFFGYILHDGKKSGIINLSSVVAANPRWEVVDDYANEFVETD